MQPACDSWPWCDSRTSSPTSSRNADCTCLEAFAPCCAVVSALVGEGLLTHRSPVRNIMFGLCARLEVASLIVRSRLPDQKKFQGRFRGHREGKARRSPALRNLDTRHFANAILRLGILQSWHSDRILKLRYFRGFQEVLRARVRMVRGPVMDRRPHT